MTDYTKLHSALRQLQRQLANLEGADARPELRPLDREAIAESVIQRFETAYDVLWKTLKRHLIHELGVADLANSPKPVFREAYASKLLPSDPERWFAYADARTATAHDYSGEKAAETLQMIPAFLADALTLYQSLTGTPSEP